MNHQTVQGNVEPNPEFLENITVNIGSAKFNFNKFISRFNYVCRYILIISLSFMIGAKIECLFLHFTYQRQTSRIETAVNPITLKYSVSKKPLLILFTILVTILNRTRLLRHKVAFSPARWSYICFIQPVRYPIICKLPTLLHP